MVKILSDLELMFGSVLVMQFVCQAPYFANACVVCRHFVKLLKNIFSY